MKKLRLHNLPKVTKVASSRSEIRIQFGTRVYILNHTIVMAHDLSRTHTPFQSESRDLVLVVFSKSGGCKVTLQI